MWVPVRLGSDTVLPSYAASYVCVGLGKCGLGGCLRYGMTGQECKNARCAKCLNLLDQAGGREDREEELSISLAPSFFLLLRSSEYNSRAEKSFSERQYRIQLPILLSSRWLTALRHDLRRTLLAARKTIYPLHPIPTSASRLNSTCLASIFRRMYPAQRIRRGTRSWVSTPSY